MQYVTNDLDVREETTDPLELSRRVCDQCRSRKIRCDRQTPCSNCSIAKQHCSFTGAGQRPKEPRHRILITSQYEKKIDHLESQLSRIEIALHDIAQSQSRIEVSTSNDAARLSTAFSPPSQSMASSASVAPSNQDSRESQDRGQCRTPTRSDAEPNESTPHFEGGSSMTAHAAFAGDFLETAVEQRALQDVRPELRVSLSSLRGLLAARKQGNEAHLERAKPLEMDELRDLPMPPLDAVLRLLRELKENIPQTFTLFCALTSVRYFTEQCQRIYFATEDFSQSTFIIVNAGLFYILQEKIILDAGNELAVDAWNTYREMCRVNLETALSRINILLRARKDSVEALVMGASYAIDISKPSLAWSFSTMACQLCLSLGYHRHAYLIGEDDDARNRRAVLFWCAYILDKALALRLGRPSTLQDYDITLSRTIQPIVEFGDHIDNIQSWRNHAEIQGKMYRHLFSPSAMRQPLEQRIQVAQDYAQSLLEEGDVLYRRRKQFESNVSPNNQSGANISAMLLRSDEVALLSSLTLIYRTIPSRTMNDATEAPTTFGDDCVFIARKAMDLHLECTRLSGTNRMLAATHAHWSVSFTPFIPFIVLFCSVLETSDLEDLGRIKNFMLTLEPWVELSEHVERLFRLCQLLHNIALLCVETMQSQNQHRTQYPQITESGPMLNRDNNMHNFDLDHSPSSSLSYNVQLQDGRGPELTSQSVGSDDWFSGYMNLVGLSEFNLPV
ncbi:fungal-specific transcription factor domain-containing protein [Lophiotrema nucula]|uniref:Fungal-specific transcription factor domain-containing protein n=1 Tax=Lophiotrema nucula TaxID=690887 RepID=A0A6A5YWH9_9PLEO|nr:fungal-specific transcription factor domain-containing protein [Lophiotrema nucula]